MRCRANSRLAARTISDASCSIRRSVWAVCSIRRHRPGLDSNDKEFGLTLGHWGVHAGSLRRAARPWTLRSVRDVPGKVVDTYTNPRQYIKNPMSSTASPSYLHRQARLAAAARRHSEERLRPVRLHSRRLPGASRVSHHRKRSPEEPLVDPDADMPDCSPARRTGIVRAPGSACTGAPAQEVRRRAARPASAIAGERLTPREQPVDFAQASELMQL